MVTDVRVGPEYGLKVQDTAQSEPKPAGKSLLGELGLPKTLAHRLMEHIDDCEKRRNSYEQQIVKTADRAEISKLLLLIDISALERYVTLTRMQAENSFAMSKRTAYLGFVLLLTAVGVGIYSQMGLGAGRSAALHPLDIAYLTAAMGLVTQFLSGIFLYMYRTSLNQVNRFHERLESSRKVCVSLYLANMISDAHERDAVVHELIGLLGNAWKQEQPQLPTQAS